MSYGIKDYPLAEKHPEHVTGARGKKLSDITLDALLKGDVTIEDLRITPVALQSQASVAYAGGRPRLADNFERAAELVYVPQDMVMHAYEMLRPGRAKSGAELVSLATDFRSIYKAERIASFIEEAANIYEKRGLFAKRY
jgi:propanediol dehydratase small subunit